MAKERIYRLEDEEGGEQVVISYTMTGGEDTATEIRMVHGAVVDENIICPIHDMESYLHRRHMDLTTDGFELIEG